MTTDRELAERLVRGTKTEREKDGRSENLIYVSKTEMFSEKKRYKHLKKLVRDETKKKKVREWPAMIDGINGNLYAARIEKEDSIDSIIMFTDSMDEHAELIEVAARESPDVNLIYLPVRGSIFHTIKDIKDMLNTNGIDFEKLHELGPVCRLTT